MRPPKDPSSALLAARAGRLEDDYMVSIGWKISDQPMAVLMGKQRYYAVSTGPIAGPIIISSS